MSSALRPERLNRGDPLLTGFDPNKTGYGFVATRNDDIFSRFDLRKQFREMRLRLGYFDFNSRRCLSVPKRLVYPAR